MKRYYAVQIAIDSSIVVLGLLVYLFPHLAQVNANMIFYTLMSVYAGLELLEYLIGGESKESLYLFLAASVGAFSGIFLRHYNVNNVLSITFVFFLSMYVIIKIINLENIYKKKTRLFTIKIGALSFFLVLGILVSINVYFEISKVSYMLALFYISYGYIELLCDMFDYLSEDVKFLKE